MTSTIHTPSRSLSVPIRGGLAILLAVLANVVLVLGVDALAIAPAIPALNIPPVAFLSALGAGGGNRTFVRVAVIVVLLSFVPDVALLAIDPATTLPAVLVLMVMHVVVAAVSVWVLRYWRAER